MTNAVNLSTVAATGFLRNRIINGAMVIDQRNAGAVVTVASGATNYIADRFAFTNNASNSVTIQQVTDAPVDFSYSSKVTIGSANTLGSTQYIDLFHNVEGYNFADMAWGTVSAKTITVSFWVKSSVPGIHGGMVINNTNNRTFAFTYTISAANTWEYETVTIPGDVTGTWNTTNLRGVGLFFTMGAGATYLTSPNVWTAGVFLAPTTAVNLAAVAGATWQITGVQLEVGTVATPFERRLYGTELALCQRYLPAFIPTSTGTGQGPVGQSYAATNALVAIPFQVPARVFPTGISVTNATNFAVTQANTTRVTASAVSFNGGSPYGGVIDVAVASGLVAGNATVLWVNTLPCQILFTGCEL